MAQVSWPVEGLKVRLWAGGLEYALSVLGEPWKSVHQARQGLQGHPRPECSGPTAGAEHHQMSSYPTSDPQGSWRNLQKPLPPVLFLQCPPLRKLNRVITVKKSLKGFQSLLQSRY